MHVITSNPKFRNTFVIPSVTTRYDTNYIRRDGFLGLEEAKGCICLGDKIDNPRLVKKLLESTEKDMDFQDELTKINSTRYVGDYPEVTPSLVEMDPVENVLMASGVNDHGLILAQTFQKPELMTDDDWVLGDL